MRVWLAERWCCAEYLHRVQLPYSQPSFLHSNEDEDNSTMADVPWLLGALRCCDVLKNLTRQFTLHVLSTIAKVIENEVLLFQSHRIAVDVLVKLAKPIVLGIHNTMV